MFPHFCTVFTEIYIAISQSDSRNVFHVFYHYQNNSGTVLRDYTGMSYDYCTSVFVQAEKITSRHFSLLVLSIFRKNSRNIVCNKCRLDKINNNSGEKLNELCERELD